MFLLLKIDDENRGSFPNRGEVVKHEMRSPSLVARLMGLESMPSSHRDKGKKKKTNGNVFDEEEEEENGFDKSRPQKMQRTTGVCDRRVVVKKFGSDALQIKNVLTRVRKHHQYNSSNLHLQQHHQHQHQKKLASPVRSPRLHRRTTSSSRLIDAAARILEPGKRKIAYPGIGKCENAGKEPVQVSSVAASCKACGSFVDVHGSVPVAEEMGKNMERVPEATPFERSKRNVFWRNQEPLSASGSAKGSSRESATNQKALHRVQKEERFPPEARAYRLQSKRVCSSSSSNAINCKEKDFIAMNRGSTRMNHHHLARFENSDLRKSQSRVEESCNRSGLSTTTPPPRKRRLACVSDQGRGSSSISPVSRRLEGECSCDCSNGTPFKLGSLPHRSYGEPKERTGLQRRPNQKRLPLDAGTLGLIQQKLKKLAAQEEDEAIIRGSGLPNQSSASLILHELLSSLALEQRYIHKAYRVCL